MRRRRVDRVLHKLPLEFEIVLELEDSLAVFLVRHHLAEVLHFRLEVLNESNARKHAVFESSLEDVLFAVDEDSVSFHSVFRELAMVQELLRNQKGPQADPLVLLEKPSEEGLVLVDGGAESLLFPVSNHSLKELQSLSQRSSQEGEVALQGVELLLPLLASMVEEVAEVVFVANQVVVDDVAPVEGAIVEEKGRDVEAVEMSAK